MAGWSPAGGARAALRPVENASLEKAIEIKRRAQRCLQSGDLDGALSEYEKLTRAEDSEPMNFVLLADLFFKKGDAGEAARRYLQAVDAYEKAALYKNAIAVCKKMARLALSPVVVLQRLAQLHALDGLSTEAALYFQEFAEHQAREQKYREAADSLRHAFEAVPENVRVLEKASECLLLADDKAGAARLLIEAARHHAQAGRPDEAAQARARAEELMPGAEAAHEAASAPAELESAEPEPAGPEPAEPGSSEPEGTAAAKPGGWEPMDSEERVSGPEHRPNFAPLPPAPPGATAVSGEAPPAPAGLRFERPPEHPPAEGGSALAEVEELLEQAAEKLKEGERDAASELLVRAARAYEAHDRLDNAAAIYRSLGRSAHATPEAMGLWLRNCELRGDIAEAADVACALGDRALNEGDTESAREWFVRALRHAPEHELARRRMQRLGSRSPQPARPPAAPGANGSPAPGGEESGRIEVAVGRAQAVTFDLGSLISEFQRGVQAQLSGDPQSHYDLGMTYREMGLFEQAVECFRSAGRDPDFGQRAAEMIGRCMLDQGRFDDAVDEFTRALESLEGQPEAVLGLRFQLGLAHEVAGHSQEALDEFERVYAAQPNYPDVASKIRVLRRTLESV